MNIPDASDLVEDSLKCLDAAGVADADFRAAARRLYMFEDQYQSRATFFRMMDLLERRGYFLTVPVEDHPRYEDHQDHFEALDPGSVSPVFREPSEDWDETDNPVVGFVNGSELYVERGSELHEELVEDGELSGEQAEMPEEATLYEAVADVAEAADAEDDLDLVLRWYAALGFHVGMESGEDEEVVLDELQTDEDVGRFRRIVGEVDDLEMKLHHPSRDLDVPPPPLREAHPVLEWWFDLV